MADELGIRNALAAALNNLDMVETGEVRVFAFMLPNPLSVAPVIEVFPDKFTYDSVSLRTDELRFKVRALTGNVLSESAQDTIDALLATADDNGNSIKAVLEEDGRLDGLANDVTVEQSTGYRTYAVEVPGAPTQHMLGCEWTVCVIADR